MSSHRLQNLLRIPASWRAVPRPAWQPPTPGLLATKSRAFASSTRTVCHRIKPVRLWRDAPRRPPSQTRHASSKSSPEFRPEQTKSMSDRMKEMSKKYGWVVVGTYLGLSALDYPFCFLAVRCFGTERIAEVEHAIVDGFWGIVEKAVPSLQEKRVQKEAQELGEEASSEVVPRSQVNVMTGKHEEPSIWTQLLIAYGVHKSLFFIRIPITLAILPRVVKTLRGWGFKVGKSAAT